MSGNNLEFNAGKDAGLKLDESKFNNAMDDARQALGMQAYAPGESHELRNAAIAGGTGFAVGAGATALGEIALTKAVDTIARPFGAMAFGVIGGGRAASSIMYAPPLRAIECLTPKPIVIGGLAAAALAVGAYELYEYMTKKD